MIYFIQNETTKAIKIGYSIDVQKRLSQLQTAVAEKLTLIGQIPGKIEHERALHDRFRAYHLRGEWFRGDTGLAEELTAMSETERATLTTAYWGSHQALMSILEDMLSDSAGFMCVITSPSPGRWMCSPHPEFSDPSFREFYESDECEYRKFSYEDPLWSASRFVSHAVRYWKSEHKPGQPRLFCDTDGAEWRRPRLQTVVDRCNSAPDLYFNSYVKQLTDTGSGLRVYWRYRPLYRHARLATMAWRNVTGASDYAAAFDLIHHVYGGSILDFAEVRSELVEWDAERKASHLKIVG